MRDISVEFGHNSVIWIWNIVRSQALWKVSYILSCTASLPYLWIKIICLKITFIYKKKCIICEWNNCFYISYHKNCCGKKASRDYKQQKRDLNNLSKRHEIIGCSALCMISLSSSFPCCQSFDPLHDIIQKSGRYRKQGSWSREEWADISNTISKELPNHKKMKVLLLNLLYKDSEAEQV